MTFNRQFFETFNDKVKQYRAAFWTGIVTVTIKVAHDREFHVNRIIASDDDLLTFAYFETKKQRALPKKIQDERGELTAFPVVTLPYSAIHWVEINPGTATGSKKQVGFQQKE